MSDCTMCVCVLVCECDAANHCTRSLKNACPLPCVSSFSLSSTDLSLSVTNCSLVVTALSLPPISSSSR